MSRIGKIISELENLHQQDIKNSSRIFGISATLALRLKEILNTLEIDDSSSNLLLDNPSKNDLIARYGNYNNAYRAYKETYNIKGVKGWDALLQSIRGLELPASRSSLEQRVAKLEKTVKILGEILLDNIPSNEHRNVEGEIGREI